ncbi:transglutaminase-like cysteine peptidase [uncultured Desulfovibrio sp.]|uniref:transglutaminase-like cysteine peptidase n=1 Tax=uncultured Desulfovibrio sp. TaxID=167968 RepID=UPI002606F04B|nr:transglutaminase-like cysteine peptidase [uncultured Desulfovibrio sp.]
MPKLRHSKFALVAALSGGMAALLACLLFWAYGWNPALAGSLNLQPRAAIGNAEVSEPPAVSSAAAENNAVPPVAAPEQASTGAEQNGNTGANAVLPPADQQRGLQPDRQPVLQTIQQAGADSSAQIQPDADNADQLPSPDPSQSTGKSDFSTAANAAAKVAAPDAAKGAAQSAAQPAPAHDSKVQLFGTVEFKRPLSTLPGWLDLLKRNQMDPIFIPGKVFKKGVTWDTFKSKAPLNNKMELLRYVNSFWNTWPYVEDIVNWGQEDYWEIPAEFLKKSGDCEDYSIIKYFTLKELGIPPESMRVVVVRDTIRNFAHAVLVVYLNDDAFILDNLSNSVLSHTKVRQYSPQYSVNEFGRWAHMKGRKIN